MMKKRWISLLITVLFLGILPVPTAYAAETVQVYLPSHDVTLNGQTFSSDYSRYPFLVYHDITYFPTTYYDCKLLGLRNVWTKEDGLTLEKTDANLSEYIREVQPTKNAKVQQAQIAEGPITVNGKVIDNSREPYPILSFRNVTYFPLTWRFAVEEFGWDYQFDEAAGLTISNSEVAFLSEKEWDGWIDAYGSLMGTGDMELAGIFEGYRQEEQANPSIGLYNITGADIQILDDDFQWEYQIYRVIGDKEELVYRKAIPFYSGELPVFCYAYMRIADNYWNENTPSGDYRCVLVHPSAYHYQLFGEEQIRTAPTEGNGYAVTFSDTVTRP